MSVSEKTMSHAAIWGNRLVWAFILIILVRYALHPAFLQTSISAALIALLSLCAAACFLVMGLGGPKPRAWDSFVGGIFALSGIIDLIVLFRGGR